MFERSGGDEARQATIAELRRLMTGNRTLVTEPGQDRGVLEHRAGYLPVIEPLTGFLPGGGLPRGGVVSLAGTGTTSLLFTLLAGPGNPWSALVGLPYLGLQAAAELGVDLSRVVLIPDPGVDVLQILSVLADGVELLVVRAPNGPIASPARLRVLQGRLRQRGSVLISVGAWPGADLSLQVAIDSWRGIGAGHGRLTGRELLIQLSGRGSAGRRRELRLLLAADAADRSGRVTVSVADREADRALGAVPGTGIGLPVAVSL